MWYQRLDLHRQVVLLWKPSLAILQIVVYVVLSQWVHDFGNHCWLTKDFIKSVTCGVIGKSTSNEVFNQVPDMFSQHLLVSNTPCSLCCEKACRHSFARTHILLYHFKRLRSSWGSQRAHWFPVQEANPKNRRKKQLFCRFHRSSRNQEQCSSLESTREALFWNVEPCRFPIILLNISYKLDILL